MGTTGELLHKLIPITQLVQPHMASITCNRWILCTQSSTEVYPRTPWKQHKISLSLWGWKARFHPATQVLYLSIKWYWYCAIFCRFVYAGLVTVSIAVLTTHFWLQWSNLHESVIPHFGMDHLVPHSLLPLCTWVFVSNMLLCFHDITKFDFDATIANYYGNNQNSTKYQGKGITHHKLLI